MSRAPDSFDASITHFFHQARKGDAAGMAELWRRYLPRLLNLARQTLRGRFQSALGPEDIVQSAFGTFWRRAQNGDFGQWTGRDELWNLLAVITVRKVHAQTRREFAVKRGGGKTRPEVDVEGSDNLPFRLEEAVVELPTAEFDLCCEEYLLALDEDERSTVILKLMGHTNAEAAELLDCSESKIERKLRIARKVWEAAEGSNSK